MKTIEKVARALYEYNNPSSMPANVDRGFPMYLQEAQAAIQALDIIILPADAEPQVGDVLQDKFNKELFSVSLENKRFNSRGTFGTAKADEHLRIILRNGKLAIQETTEGA